MKRISKILLGLLCILGFTASVSAASYASSSITVYNDENSYNYVSGIKVNHLTYGGYNIYILNTGTTYKSGATLSDPQQANNGFAYIVNNSNNMTHSSYQNYYIAQVAILWYQDYLNGNDANISAELKDYISKQTGDIVCSSIYKLVNYAKNYSSNGNSIKFLDKSVTFTKNGNYYYSNVIDVETYNLNTTPSVRLYNAPSSASIINNTVTSNGKGSFQIRIPTSSLTSFSEKDFEVYITGGSYNNVVYKYSNYGYGEVIYGRTYSSSGSEIEAGLPVHIDGIANTTIRINVLDRNGNNISGLSYSLYYGDCSNTVCYSDDLVQSFTTRSSYTELSNVLSTGVYTLVNRSTDSSYNLPNKVTFTIDNSRTIQDINIIEDNYYNNGYNYNYNYNNNDYPIYYDDYTNYNNYYRNNDYPIYYDYYDDIVDYDSYVSSSRLVNIYNKIYDSKDIINVYTISNVLISSYRSDVTNQELRLNPGTYYVEDTLNKFNRIYFRVDNYGNLYVKYENEYILASYIILDNEYQDRNTNSTVIDKVYDEDTNTYYVNGLGDSITITNEIDTTTDVKIEWLSNVVDCPITSLDATVKYIIGSMIVVTGLYMVVRNVKKNENNA